VVLDLRGVYLREKRERLSGPACARKGGGSHSRPKGARDISHSTTPLL
jgi:hypothetical protein